MIRTIGIALVLAVATLGDGGATPASLLAQRALLVLLAWGVLASPRPADRGLPPPVLTAGACGAVLILAGAVLAPYAYAAWLVVVELATLAFVVWLAAACGPALLPWTAAALGGVAIVQAAIAVGERAAGVALRPSAEFFNANHLAAWLVAVAFLGGGVSAGRGRAARLGYAALLVVTIGALVLIGSRAAVAGVVAGAVVVAALTARRVPPVVRRRLLAGLAAAAVIAILGVALRFQVRDPFGLSRPAIWRASLGALAQDPWWGTKPGQFAIVSDNLNFPRDDGPLRFARSFSTPHSDLLRLPCEFGLPAALALFAAAGLGAAAFVRRRETVDTAVLGALAALASLVAQAAFNDLTKSPAIALLGAVLAGCVLSTPREPRPALPAAARWAGATILLVAFAAGEAAPYAAWSIQSRLPRGALSSAQRAELDRATRLNPFLPDLALRRVQDLLARAPSWTQDDYAQAREAAERAVRLSPEAALGWTALAHVEGAACRFAFGDVASRVRAERAFAAASERSRHDPLIPIDAARFLLATGDVDGARRQAERALRIEPNAIPPRLLLAQTAEVEEAGRLRDEARSIADRYRVEARESPYAAMLLTLDAPLPGD